MKRIHIDFAPRTGWRSILRGHILGHAACCAAFTACIGACWITFSLLQQKKVLEQDRKRLNGQIAKQALVRKGPTQALIAEAQANAINVAVSQLNLPWRDLLDAIEAATPPAIALLTLDPDAKRRTIKITAEARDSADMINYIELIKRQSFFADAILTRHESNEQDPNKPIRFQLETQWAEYRP
jgi:Tfp pilus assembly protein PilN